MGKTERVVTRSPRETQRYFRKIAKRLSPGNVIGFSGELGSGKTTAIQSILQSFGLAGGESPTFVMVMPYQLRRPRGAIERVIHVDAYRLNSQREAESAGLTDVLRPSSDLVLVEWADRIRAILPPGTIWVNLAHQGQDKRKIEVVWP